jgi:hypothetical protein
MTAVVTEADVITETSVTHADGSRDYPYPPTGEMLKSVTTIIGGTVAKPWLPAWAAGLAAECAVDNLDLVARLIADEGRDTAVRYLKNEAARVRDRKRDTGGYVHDMVEALIMWQASPEGYGRELSLPLLPDHLQGADYDGMPVEDVAEWMIDGFLNWVSDWKPAFEAAEMPVYNQPLGYAGTLDMIAGLPGVAIGRTGRFIAGPGVSGCVDVKTGREPGPVAEQVAAYRRATECRPDRLSAELEPVPATSFGAVLHLRPEYRRGYRFIPVAAQEDELGWENFRAAAGLLGRRRRQKVKPGKVCWPPRADGTVPQPFLDDLEDEGYGRILTPLRKAGFENLEQVAAKTAGQFLKTRGIKDKTLDGIRAMLADHGLHLAGEAPAMTVAAA